MYKCGGKLVGERTKAPRIVFVDDAAIMTPIRDNIVKATVELDRVVRACGLNISIPNTKFLVTERSITQDYISIGDGS